MLCEELLDGAAVEEVLLVDPEYFKGLLLRDEPSFNSEALISNHLVLLVHMLTVSTDKLLPPVAKNRRIPILLIALINKERIELQV